MAAANSQFRCLDGLEPVGRPDPFASVAQARLAGPGQPALPPALQNFRFNGVIASGGHPKALVQFGNVSGSLGPGDQGGRTTDLLPAGWSVQAVDVQRGLLVLRQADRTITAEL